VPPTAAATLGQDEAFARIRLLRSPNVGPVSYRQLLARFGSAEAALAALPDLAGRGGAPYRPASEARVAEEIAAVRKAGARFLFADSPDYPPLLRESEGAPPILVARGDSALAARPAVAIVGARNASAAAVRLAREFGGALAEAGYAVVSGLARGIDGAAHQGALARAAGGGGTIGVIASGIDRAYPPNIPRCRNRSRKRACCLPNSPRGPSRSPATSPRVTASSPASPRARWWSRRHGNRAR
jgi:DNA processing protein